MQQFVAGLHGGANQDTPLARAQALMYQAFEEPNEQRRVQLARQALEISSDCADACVLLAEHAPSRKEARAGYESAPRVPKTPPGVRFSSLTYAPRGP